MPCSKGMTGCAASCLHRTRIETYKWDRINWEQRFENATLGYKPEGVDFREVDPAPTLKQHLIQTKGERPVVDVPYEKQRKLSTAEMNEGKAYIRELITSDLQKAATEIEARRAAFFAYEQHSPGSVTELRLATERELLATVMKAPSALPALQALDVDRELLHPFHRNVARAITDLAERGEEFDATAVTAELRDRPLVDAPREAPGVTDKPYGIDNPWTPTPPPVATQLPAHMDPESFHPSMDPEQIGLQEWQHNAAPAQAAPAYAQQIRTAYRGDYIEAACQRGAALARGATAESLNGLSGTDSVGTVLGQVAQELVNVPPELGYDLKPIRGQQAPEASSVRLVTPTQNLSLDLPSRPVLSAASQQILARG